LRIAKDFFTKLGLRKELGQPCYGGDELHAHADEDKTSKDQQHLNGGREAGRERRDGVDQNAEGEHSATAEEVRQIAAEQSKYAAGKRGNVKEAADPGLELG
jgi:hypothetical protein